MPNLSRCVCGHGWDDHGHAKRIGGTACQVLDCKCEAFRISAVPGVPAGTPTEKPQLSSREKNERALGRAAHPRALDRLHEIFPEAEVGVLHGTVARFMGSPAARFTTVSLSTPDGDVVANTQWTYAPVQWDRRRSLARAFHCLLKDVCERTNEAERAMGDAGKGS